MSEIALVVLAAGHARRMGGPNKLLMDWAGAPLVSWCLKPLVDQAFSRRIFVTGRDAKEVVQAANLGPDWVIVHNEAAQRGMASSLLCGLAMVPDGHSALVVLGDMPDVSQELVTQMMGRWDDGAYALVPSYQGAWGNPVILGPRAISDCAALTGDLGARGLLLANVQACLVVETDCAGVLFDLDRPSDFTA
jgi:molybdenum cofactor cytidylyltransferase